MKQRTLCLVILTAGRGAAWKIAMLTQGPQDRAK